MNKKSVWPEIAYLLLSLVVYWVTTRDGPSLKVSFWHGVTKVSRVCAYSAGRVALFSEDAYYHYVERTRL